MFILCSTQLETTPPTISTCRSVPTSPDILVLQSRMPFHIRGYDGKTVQTAFQEENMTLREKAKAERDIKTAERQAAMEERKAETSRKKAEREAEKQEKLEARRAQKEEALAKLHNEEKATEQTLQAETTKVELASAEAMKKMDNEAEQVKLDFDYKKEGLTLTHDYQKEKLTRTADLYDKSMDAMQLHMKQEHEARMEEIRAKKETLMKALGGAKTLQFKTRTGNSQFLTHLQNESKQAGRI